MAATTPAVICKQFKINPFFWYATAEGQAALIARKLFYLFLVTLEETNSKCLGVFWIAEVQSLRDDKWGTVSLGEKKKAHWNKTEKEGIQKLRHKRDFDMEGRTKTGWMNQRVIIYIVNISIGPNGNKLLGTRSNITSVYSNFRAK